MHSREYEAWARQAEAVAAAARRREEWRRELYKLQHLNSARFDRRTPRMRERPTVERPEKQAILSDRAVFWITVIAGAVGVAVVSLS